MTIPAGPSWQGLLIAALPVVAVIVLLWVRGLGQVPPLVVAIFRLCVQLMLLGLVLDWLFRVRSPWIVGAVAAVMLAASSQVVGNRFRRQKWLVSLESFAAMGISVALVMGVSIFAALRPDPWYEPRVVIPLLGMILGNSATAVALAAERFASDLRNDRDLVELRLSLGATSRQAAFSSLHAAVRAALTPAINNMMIAGIVSIPGMTTGQILAGADVHAAIRYQILIYLGITATVAFSTIGLLEMRLRRYFTAAHQLRMDELGENFM